MHRNRVGGAGSVRLWVVLAACAVLVLFLLAVPVLERSDVFEAPIDRHGWLLTRQFEQLALSSEYEGAKRANRIIRWPARSLLRVCVTGRGREAVMAVLERQLAELAELTGLHFRVLPENFAHCVDRAQLDIHLLSGEEISRVRFGAQCFVELYADDYVLRRGKILIPNGSRVTQDHCVAEELTQAMGLLNDSDILRNSIFHRGSRLIGLTGADRLMVRILYDGRIRVGDPAHRVKARVREILRELRVREAGR